MEKVVKKEGEVTKEKKVRLPKYKVKRAFTLSGKFYKEGDSFTDKNTQYNNLKKYLI